MKYKYNLFLDLDDSDDVKSYKVWLPDNEVITTLSKYKNKSKTLIVHELLVLAQSQNYYLQDIKAFADTSEFQQILEYTRQELEKIEMESFEKENSYFLQEDITALFLDVLNRAISKVGEGDKWNATSLIYVFSDLFSEMYNELIEPLLKHAPVLVDAVEWRFVLATLWEMKPEQYYLFEMAFSPKLKTTLESNLTDNKQLWHQFIKKIINAFDVERNYIFSVYDERLPNDFFDLEDLKTFIANKKKDHIQLLQELTVLVDHVINELRNEKIQDYKENNME